MKILVLSVATLLTLAGCSVSTSTQSSESPMPSATAESVDNLPKRKPYRPSPYDVQPLVKLRAAQLVEAIGTWNQGDAGAMPAQTRTRALGFSSSLVASAASLLSNAPQAVTNAYFAQYGGIQPDTASVMVLCDQWLQNAEGSIVHRGTTVDVRLSKSAPFWTVTALHPAVPHAPANPAPTLAARVLANPRIQLPFAARADVRSGTVSDGVLRALETLSRKNAIGVSIVESGHPINVFGTDRPSDHPPGFAVDIWQIDGRDVVDPSNYRLAADVMRAGIAAGAYQAGGPIQLEPTSEYFTDDTHKDHVHLGFRS